MVVRLARALDVPLRERNGLLVAAGYVSMYALEPLGLQLDRVDRPDDECSTSTSPSPPWYGPAWDLVRTNRGSPVAVWCSAPSRCPSWPTCCG